MTTASTKRNPDPVNGVVGPAVTKLSSVTLSFTPFPVSPDIAAEYRLETPRKTYVTGVFGFPDIKEGDILTTGGIDFIVKATAKWTDLVLYTKIYMEKQM